MSLQTFCAGKARWTRAELHNGETRPGWLKIVIDSADVPGVKVEELRDRAWTPGHLAPSHQGQIYRSLQPTWENVEIGIWDSWFGIFVIGS